MTPEEFMDGAVVTPLGGDWGVPLWRFENEEASLCVDVQAATEDEAHPLALAAVTARLAPPPDPPTAPTCATVSAAAAAATMAALGIASPDLSAADKKKASAAAVTAAMSALENAP